MWFDNPSSHRLSDNEYVRLLSTTAWITHLTKFGGYKLCGRVNDSVGPKSKRWPMDEMKDEEKLDMLSNEE